MPNRAKTTQRKIAAKMLKCGTKRVWMDPTEMRKIEAAITRNDIARLVKEGIIKKLPEKKHRKIEKRSSQKAGSRRGKKGARCGSAWLKIVRPQRKLLKELKPKLGKSYRKLYMKVKGGAFRSKAHLKSYIEKDVYAQKKA